MDYEPNIRWKGGWLSLIENYSERKLSNPEDKLSAIGGLARILSERTKSAYFAGLWQHHIYEDLCWRTYEYEERLENWIAVKGRMLGQAKRSPSYRAPSWSWASVDGPIRFVPLVYQLLTARVIKCDTIPHGKDPFGRLKGGRLVIDVSKETLQGAQERRLNKESRLQYTRSTVVDPTQEDTVFLWR